MILNDLGSWLSKMIFSDRGSQKSDRTHHWYPQTWYYLVHHNFFFSNRNGGNILKQDHSLLSPVRFLGMKMKNPKLYQKLTTLVSHRKTKMNGFDKDNLKITSEKILEIVSSENDEGMNLIINIYLSGSQSFTFLMAKLRQESRHKKSLLLSWFLWN